MKGIFWLASYPKSGNTWFRVFLAHLLNTSKKPLDLDQINTGFIASSRILVDSALGFESALLTHDELDLLRPRVYEWLGLHAEKTHYHKIHDAYTYLSNAEPLIPTAGCLGALYMIRNPLDVAVSFANHLNCSIDESIRYMGDPSYVFCGSHKKQQNQLRQQLLSWSMHVKSWTELSNINTLVIRYEDMKLNALYTFTRASQFLNLEADAEDIQHALACSNIERLQLLENNQGFREKPAKTKHFFRKGIVGDWKNTLTARQVDQLIQDHGEVMALYGYI